MKVESTKSGALFYLPESVKIRSRISTTFSDCFINEKVNLPAERDPPIFLSKFLTNCGSQARHFRKHVRDYNNAISITSVTTNWIEKGQFCFAVLQQLQFED